MKDVQCPYCEEGQDINHDDGYGYNEDTIHQQECSCGKTFIYTTSIIMYYEAEKADCLNEGGNHQWKNTITYPKEFTEMVCVICDKHRKCTPEEMEEVMKIK